MRRGGLVLVAALVALAVSAGTAQATFSGQNGRLLSGDSVECYPPLCPNPSAPPQLASYLLDGSGQQQLSEPPNDNSGGEWSPDGSQVAYISLSDDGTNRPGGIAVVNADGSNQRLVLQLDTANEFPQYLSWMPDGKHLLYQLTNAYAGSAGPLFEIDLSGKTQVPVAGGKVVDKSTLSPNGQHIAYVDDALGALHVMDFNGLNDQVIYTPPANNVIYTRVDWSPDSKQLIFDTTPTGAGGGFAQNTFIHEIKFNGTGLTQIGSGMWPLWSPDGTKIGYWGLNDYKWVVANTDGSNPQEVNSLIPEGWQAVP
jgi:Tol biopolymer transport system component